MPTLAGGFHPEKIMLKVGLTGGIGSGKTVVAGIFRQLGVPVYDADTEARLLTENNSEIKAELQKKFGSDIFLKSGSLDRSKLSSLVFSNPEKLNLLNSIIHPIVKQHFISWLEGQSSPYIIKEAAILFESGSHRDLDRTIVVTAPEEIRIHRVITRDNTTREKIKDIMKNQWSEEELIKRSDYIVTNDDQTLVIPQVLKLHQLLSSEAEHSK
jgi:dephospho-CoA kinase